MLFKKGDEDEGTKEEAGSVNFAKAPGFQSAGAAAQEVGGGREGGGKKREKKLKKWMQIH